MHTERFHALDTVRAFALLSGIVLHATMTFMPGLASFGFPADASQSTSLQTVFYVIHLFRMTLFFVIAGFFAHLVFHRKGLSAFLQNRSKRILVPFIIGWLFFGPLVMGVIFFTMAPTIDWQSMPKPQGFPLAHLWFLYYLMLFYVAALVLRSIFSTFDGAGIYKQKIDNRLNNLIKNHIMVFVLTIPFALCLYCTPNWILAGGIPSPDTGFTPQIPATFCFGMAFIFGWLLHRQHQVLNVWQQSWPMHLLLAILATFLSLWLSEKVPDNNIKLTYVISYSFAIWNWVFALIGIALQFFSRESRVIRYLADASYWMYLAHLPVVFLLQMIVLDWPLHWSIKFPLLLAATLMILLVAYHYLVRNTYIGEILNGQKYSRKNISPAINAEDTENTINFSKDNVSKRAVVELISVRKAYGNNLALKGLDLQIYSGELLAFLGPNGAGKSTTISCLLGQQLPDAGSITIFGESPNAITARYQCGTMLQHLELPPELRVRELIDLSCSYYPSSMSVKDVMELTNISAIASRPYGKLSGGQKRLVQFAIAICGRPKLLVLDEPTVGMDIETRQRLWATLRQLVAQGCAVVLTTHYLEEAEALADRVAVLAQGKLVMLGTVDQVRARVVHTHISCNTQLDAEYITSWPGVISANRDGHCLRLIVSNSDQVVRRLSQEDPDLHNLEISRAGLADAFTHITQEFA